MKTIILLAVVLSISVARNASARMGETVAQCARRYGSPGLEKPPSPVIPGVPNREYSYQGWRITVAFIKGRAAMLRYAKANSQKIQDDEAQAILKAETYGGSWTEKTQFTLNPAKNMQNLLSHPRLWTNGIGAEAYFQNPSYNTFVIKAPVVEQLRKAQETQREQQRKTSIPEF